MAWLRTMHMPRWARGRGRIRGAAAVAAIAVAAATTAAFTGALAQTSSTPTFTRQGVAQHILRTEAARVMTAPAQTALRMLATGSKQVSPGLVGQSLPAERSGAPQPGAAGAALPAGAFTNVRVNDPSQDTHQLDQTTQSETSIAVAGDNVAVGYNDSQQSGLFLTAGSNLSGYSYSTDGGATFTDGGDIPNAGQFNNFGDPWLTSDKTGAMYYSTLAQDGFSGNLDVAVAKSTNGGKTWGTPVLAYRPPSNLFYFGDKDAITAGPDPLATTRDNLYATWDDFVFNMDTGKNFTGLPVAHSTNGGKTWRLAYARKFFPEPGCSFRQVIGATPVVNSANGALYVVAEKLSVYDPKCTGTAPMRRTEWIWRSTDGGNTFGAGVRIADATEAVPDGLLFLGPGRYMRDLELPTIALRGSAIYVAWNDGWLGSSHIRLATSKDGGTTWSLSWVTSGTGNDLMPALSADAAGVHLLYYHSNSNLTLDVFVGDSATGTAFTRQRVTTQSFRGTLTIPQFDPIIAWGYMGDYIANVSDGTHRYFAWGDNRDTVTNFMYPKGRNDPDVFFAKN